MSDYKTEVERTEELEQKYAEGIQGTGFIIGQKTQEEAPTTLAGVAKAVNDKMWGVGEVVSKDKLETVYKISYDDLAIKMSASILRDTSYGGGSSIRKAQYYCENEDITYSVATYLGNNNYTYLMATNSNGDVIGEIEVVGGSEVYFDDNCTFFLDGSIYLFMHESGYARSRNLYIMEYKIVDSKLKKVWSSFVYLMNPNGNECSAWVDTENKMMYFVGYKYTSNNSNPCMIKVDLKNRKILLNKNVKDSPVSTCNGYFYLKNSNTVSVYDQNGELLKKTTLELGDRIGCVCGNIYVFKNEGSADEYSITLYDSLLNKIKKIYTNKKASPELYSIFSNVSLGVNCFLGGYKTGYNNFGKGKEQRYLGLYRKKDKKTSSPQGYGDYKICTVDDGLNIKLSDFALYNIAADFDFRNPIFLFKDDNIIFKTDRLILELKPKGIKGYKIKEL